MIERLPERVAIDILSKAYLTSQPANDGLLVWRDYGGCNPLRTVVPLVCRAWNRLAQSPAAARVFFRRVRIVDACILPLRKFRPDVMLHWFQTRAQPYVQELEVDLSTIFSSQPVLERISDLLAGMISGSPELRVLHLTGELNLHRVFERLPAAGAAGGLRRLRSVHVARGGEAAWGVEACVQALSAVPNLLQLQVVYRLDVEGAPLSLPRGLAGLSRLRHLSLSWPTRSALPPQAPLPDELGRLSSLITLQLRRVPATCVPHWLGNLKSLRHLYWDLSLPADVEPTPPPGLELLTELRTLYLDSGYPLVVPETLRELRTLVLVGHSFPDAEDQDWSWLSALHKLSSLRVQGSAMRQLPDALHTLKQLRSLSLNNNHLDNLPDGTWLAQLQRLHLGFNHFDRFPPALRHAKNLVELHLGEQRVRRPAAMGQTRSSPTLAVTRADVDALCALPRLSILILAQTQPVIVPEGTKARTVDTRSLRDYLWLQQRLRAHGKRLTSNDLAYAMESVPVFNIPHIDWQGRDASFVDL